MLEGLKSIKSHEHFLSGVVEDKHIGFYDKGIPYIHSFSIRENSAENPRIAFIKNSLGVGMAPVELTRGHKIHIVASKIDNVNSIGYNGNLAALFNETTGRGYVIAGYGSKDLLSWDDIPKDPRLVNSQICAALRG